MRSHLRSVFDPSREFVKSTAHSDTRQKCWCVCSCPELDLHLKSILHHHGLNWSSVSSWGQVSNSSGDTDTTCSTLNKEARKERQEEGWKQRREFGEKGKCGGGVGGGWGERGQRNSSRTPRTPSEWLPAHFPTPRERMTEIRKCCCRKLRSNNSGGEGRREKTLW